MKGLVSILMDHAARCPDLACRDYVKLLYQSEFGPGHLAGPPEEVLSRLEAEFAQAQREGYRPAAGEEPLGGGLCRVYLDPRRLSESDLPLLARCFSLTAGGFPGTRTGLPEKLGLLHGLALRGALPLDPAETEAFLADYLSRGCPAVHHSDAYAAAHTPHYRVLDRDLALYFPAFRAVERALAEGDAPVIVAVDGRCAAGKTSFARRLAKLFSCNVFHMDDFFLPSAMRTPERLAAPGGNVDYERCARELFLPLSRGEAVEFRPYDCALDLPGPPVSRPRRRLSVVEGSYSLHPALADFSGPRIFLTCGPETQLRRLSRRESEERFAQFKNRWIPLEERYFSGCGVQARANLTLDTSPLDGPA